MLLGDMKIGITQRVEYISEYGEFRDSLDQKWTELLNELNIILVPIPNTLENVEEWLDNMKCDGYILT